MSLAHDVRDVLAGAGLVTLAPAAGFTWFERFMPDTPDVAVVFYESPAGRDPELNHSFRPILNPRFQIRNRGLPNDDDAAEATARAIYDALLAVTNEHLASGDWYLGIFPVGYFGFLHRDKLGRAEFVANYEAKRD